MLALLKELAEKSRQEAGNIVYKLHQSNTDPDTLMFYEGYKDAAAATAHRESEHFQRIVVGQIVPLLAVREPVAATLPEI